MTGLSARPAAELLAALAAVIEEARALLERYEAAAPPASPRRDAATQGFDLALQLLHDAAQLAVNLGRCLPRDPVPIEPDVLDGLWLDRTRSRIRGAEACAADDGRIPRHATELF